jgi:hypothetical protein
MRAAIAIALLLQPALVSAQLTGKVVKPDASPLPNSVVELWGPLTLIRNATTDLSGRFTITDTVGGRALWVRSIGFRPVRRLLREFKGELTIVLEPMAFELARLETRSRPICPARETKEGRAAVTRMASQYSHRNDTLGLATYVRGFFGRTSDPGLGSADSSINTVGQTGSQGRGRLFLAAQIARDGYALPSQGGMGNAYGAWEYVRLDRLAQHWGDSIFLQRHLFYLRPSHGDQTVVGFCPVKQDRPEIEGILELDAASMLTRAVWNYRIRNSKELAGGEVLFAPADAGDEPSLLPVAGVYWRELLTSLYYQERSDYVQWVVGSNDSVPRLPRWTPPAFR